MKKNPPGVLDSEVGIYYAVSDVETFVAHGLSLKFTRANLKFSDWNSAKKAVTKPSHP